MKSLFKVSLLLSLVLLFVVGCQNTPNLTEPQSFGGGFPYSVNSYGESTYYPIYAGQHILVGQLEISNDADYLYVSFHMDHPWVMMLSHIHIAADINGIPKTPKGNPIPGQFAYHDYHDYEAYFMLPIELAPYDFEVGQQIVVAAHLEVIIEIDGGGGSGVIIEGPYGAFNVYDYKQGLRYDYTPVIARRSNPDVTLQFNTGVSDGAYEYFYSLGFQTPEDHPLYDGPDAWLIVEFEYPMLNKPGNDLRIIEDTWGLPYPDEVIKVWVSQDAITWHYLGEADNQTPFMGIHTIYEFDLPAELPWAKFVKVQDISNREDFAHLYPGQGNTLDGYDVNAILAIHDYEEFDEPEYDGEETAWGGNVQFNPGAGSGQWWRLAEYIIQGEDNGDI
ncbi:MAG: hypothetical protein K0B81_05230 [Candidatus Cloacimonetes bacterium]|nr:hypothetical protein [Candidatus Cloacimonadota bacterium]